MRSSQDDKKRNRHHPRVVSIHEQAQRIAEQAQTIAEQAQTISIERKKTIEIKEVVGRMSVLLSRAIEIRDPYTKGHSDHVAEILTKFAAISQFNFSDDKIDMLKMAAIIHDVGKIGINELVLNKPTKLTEAEFVMIKHHTIIGHELVEPLLLDPIIEEAVLYHHENYDGNGYPKGLKGDEIPLVARMMRIADYFDALTSSRPYRNALKPEDALRVMQENRYCFDPHLLSLFIKNLQDLTKRTT